MHKFTELCIRWEFFFNQIYDIEIKINFEKYAVYMYRD
jgi:hypothetical protein